MKFTTRIKRLVYPLYIYPKISPARKRKLHALFHNYSTERPPVKGWRLFSNMEEDGIILQLLARLRTETGYFLDIGSNDCINSNCANLAFNFNWSGVFIDADDQLLQTGKKNYALFGKRERLQFVHSFLFPDNINQVVAGAVQSGGIDFMSIDVDGNDHALWKALTVVQPKIVVIENKIEYGVHDIVVPARAPFLPGEWGASLVSINSLAAQKGYSLVAVNQAGFNAFYMRNDCLPQSGLAALAVQSVLDTPAIRNSFFGDEIMAPLFRKLTAIQ
jgi:hypothetical protein